MNLTSRLSTAFCAAVCSLACTAAPVKNGALWYDTSGHVLNAHGSGALAW